jgi:hypothetical protein
MAESAASLPSDLPPPYRYSRSSERDIDGLKVLEVEVSDIKEGRSPRTHLRMIGGEGTHVAGRALVYTDLYSRTPEDKIYSYARHSVGGFGHGCGRMGWRSGFLHVAVHDEAVNGFGRNDGSFDWSESREERVTRNVALPPRSLWRHAPQAQPKQ